MPRFTFSPSGHRPVAAARLAFLSTLIFVGLSGCGGGGGSVTNSISVFASGASSTVDGHDTDLITAVVANDTSNAGVTWGAPSIGSLSSLSSLAPTYTAPAATTAQQTVSLTATSVTDKSKSYTVTLTIPPAPTITTASLPAASALAAYSTTLAGSGGIGPYTWTLTGGTLPTGFSLSTTGVLSAAAGTTATTSATSLTFKLTDSGSPTALTASTTLSLTVGPPNAPVAGSVIYSSDCGLIAGPSTTVAINTNPVQTATTDVNGNFSFASVPYGSYTITPSLAGTNAVFSPSTQNVTVNAGGAVVAFKAAVGYSVSGTASYPTGSATGPVHVILQYWCTYGSINAAFTSDILGTTISAPGAFTINGAMPGSYKVQAWRDVANDNWPNASDPTGTSALYTVTTGNLSGTSVTMTDPTTPTFTNTPGTPAVYPIDKGVVLNAQVLNVATNPNPTFWSNITYFPEMANSYNVEWGTDQTFATYTASKNFLTKGGNQNIWILTGLTNNQQLYFRYQGVLGSTTSPWSSASSQITIGEPSTGADLVSGTVTFANAATGPLYLYFTNQSTNKT
jgi:hypothetical protein